MAVTDTHIFLTVALNEPEKEIIIGLISDRAIIAPEILPYEIGNALTALAKRKQITREEAVAAYGVTKKNPVRLIPVDIPQALKLALDCNIYAYDAYFLHCAKSSSKPLLTLDNRMKQVAVDLNIEVLE